MKTGIDPRQVRGAVVFGLACCVIAMLAGCTSGTSSLAHVLASSPSSPPSSPTTVVVSVPATVGQAATAARSKITANGLTVHVVAKYSHSKPGSVLRSQPAAGTEIAAGSTVTLVVAKAFPKVPQVTGASSKAAKATLTKAGYRVRVKVVFTSTAAGTVLAQTPPAGTELPPDRFVRLTTSSGCDKNYAGACLNPLASDYDCYGGTGDGPLYTGFVIVVGYDEFGLDGNDNDGRGCE
jgi:hypothetical protein